MRNCTIFNVWTYFIKDSKMVVTQIQQQQLLGMLWSQSFIAYWHAGIIWEIFISEFSIHMKRVCLRIDVNLFWPEPFPDGLSVCQYAFIFLNKQKLLNFENVGIHLLCVTPMQWPNCRRVVLNLFKSEKWNKPIVE